MQMKNKIIPCLLALTLTSLPGYGQFFSLSDSSLVFKNPEGKILTRGEVRELMKGVFSIRQEIKDGNKIITILPSTNDERSLEQARIDAFKNHLAGKPLPAFRFTDTGGKNWNSEDLKGQVVVVNCWFTACKPCIQEMPRLNELVKQNEGKSIVFIAPAPEEETQVKRFLKKFSFDYRVIPAAAGYLALLQAEHFPTHLVVDKMGIVREVFVGYADDIKEKLQAVIDPLLN